MKEKMVDPRVNAHFMTPGKYFIVFWSVALICGSNVALYFLLVGTGGIDKNTTGKTVRIVLIMLVYLVIMTGIICFEIQEYRDRVLLGPTLALCDAAKKVAAGDYSIRLAPMRGDGKKDEFEVLFEDFNTMAEELATTEIMKNDFISTVSHEMRTPITLISNYAEALGSENLPEEERNACIHRIREAAKRLSVLITDILKLNRLDHQKITPKKTPFNLSESIAACILSFDAKMDEKNIQLECDLDEDVTLSSDEELLSIVWTNLISNAVKFTEEYGQIRIVMKTEKDSVWVSVEDTGCGMDEKSLHHIFDRFYQADTSHATEGNGLGLALVKRIVLLLQGTVTVESTPGRGSTFTVRLPQS